MFELIAFSSFENVIKAAILLQVDISVLITLLSNKKRS